MSYATTKSKGQKDQLDKFYTIAENVDLCLQQLDLTKFDCIIEPSAGDGAFSKKLQCFAYDIEPHDASIITQDWFTLDKTQFKQFNNILVIGNPPFGQQNTLALNFINESAKFCHTIAFILPLSFKKQSVQSRINEYFHLTKEIILENKTFLLHNENYSVPCVFQVWEKQKVKRPIPKKQLTSPYFSFVSKDSADFRVQRVGGNAGVASFDLNKSEQSNFFIKNNSMLSNEDFVKLVNSTEIEFPSIEFTVGPKSLPKSELVMVLNEYFSNL